jgi:hypothetical protein
MRNLKRLRVLRTFKIKTNLKLKPPTSKGKVVTFLKKLFSFRVGLNHYNLEDDGHHGEVTIQERYMSIVIFRYQIQLIHK